MIEELELYSFHLRPPDQGKAAATAEGNNKTQPENGKIISQK